MPIVLADTTKTLQEEKKVVSPLTAACKLPSKKEITSLGLNPIHLVIKSWHVTTYMKAFSAVCSGLFRLSVHENDDL